MTTTTKTTITISLVDSDDESVSAAYYVFEDGWFTFKDDDHKAVAAYPENRVMRIKRSDA